MALGEAGRQREAAAAGAGGALGLDGDVPGTKAPMASFQASLPRDWLKRCTEGVQPPAFSTRSQESTRVVPPTPLSVSGMAVTPSTRSSPVVPTMAWPGSSSMPRWRACSVSSPIGFGAEVDDGGDGGAGLGQIEGGAIGAVVVGEQHGAPAGQRAIAPGIGRRRPRPA